MFVDVPLVPLEKIGRLPMVRNDPVGLSLDS